MSWSCWLGQLRARMCRSRPLLIQDTTDVPPPGDDLVFESVTFSRQSRGVLRCGINNVRFSDVNIIRYAANPLAVPGAALQTLSKLINSLISSSSSCRPSSTFTLASSTALCISSDDWHSSSLTFSLMIGVSMLESSSDDLVNGPT